MVESVETRGAASAPTLSESALAGGSSRSNRFCALGRLIRTRNVLRSGSLAALAVAPLGAALPHDRALIALSVAFTVGFANAANDVFDIETDRIGRRSDRPIASGAMSARSAKGIAILCATAALVAAGCYSARGAVFVGAMLFLAWLYSAVLKGTIFLGNFSVAAQTALIVPFAFLVGPIPTQWSGAIAQATLFAFAGTVLYEVAKTAIDANADETAGLRTAATQLGRESFDRSCRIFSAGALAVTALAIVLGAADSRTSTLQAVSAGLLMSAVTAYLTMLLLSGRWSLITTPRHLTRRKLTSASWAGMFATCLALL